ncbi:hypothetical protein PC110_g21781 [Phytophthora cactorum]|uniref:Uncharacterized protein n=1 Tax=Phytophthora cactorum TaxID=29920 RepID=A0A329RAV2_9STRA|nr:hypothetical protein PC120_g20961 [Phytophthora cactorum]KAG2999146.1 hypothetical protein PC120_g20974 [Phytophthora cactorum]KAG3122258.1 hypothetical protein C6341_g27043 [Phytophthora cactorum]RAW21775.1 hypothetical protein PC110_g21781 [Phytophthora cactorum]
MDLSVSRMHRNVHLIISLRQRLTLLPPVPTHKSQRLRESLNVSRIRIRLDLICDKSPPQGIETTMARQLRELTHRKIFRSQTVSVTIVHQFRELVHQVCKRLQLQAVAVKSVCQLRELTRP